MPGSIHISREVRSAARDAVAIRRAIHKYPETGFQEVRTSRLIMDALRKYRVPARRMLGTGVIAMIRGRKPGQTLLIRADMDGLPVTEENKVPYRSRVPGRMHACGHDGHVAMALTAARILQKRKSSLRGSVKFMFQPAEEGPGGALPMIRAGVLRNPKVDAALALHVWNDLPAGKIGVREGPVFASVDEAVIEIHGRGGHGAGPHQTIDPVVVAAQVVTNLQTIVSRKVDPIQSAVVTVGKIEGGTKFNVIPEKVTMLATIRSFDAKVRRHLERQVSRIVTNVSKAHGAGAKVEYIHMYPSMVNDPKFTGLVREVAEGFAGKRNVVRQDPTMGAEDMAYVLERVRGCFVMLGGSKNGWKKGPPHHSPRFNFDESVLSIGIELAVGVAERFLQ